MKKLSFLIGVGIGFLLGSRSGRGAYETLEAKVREFIGHEQIQDAAAQVKDAAHAQFDDVTDRVSQKVSDTLGAVSSAANAKS
jgi:hypothetical protein